MEKEINKRLWKEISDLQEKSSFDDRRIGDLFQQNAKLAKDNEGLGNAMEEIRKQLNCLTNTVTILALGKRSFAGRSL